MILNAQIGLNMMFDNVLNKFTPIAVVKCYAACINFPGTPHTCVKHRLAAPAKMSFMGFLHPATKYVYDGRRLLKKKFKNTCETG